MESLPKLTDEQQQLVLDNMPLVYLVIRAYRHIPTTSYEDLESRLLLRLCLCAAEFDPSRGLKPSSYIVKSLKGEARNFFRDEPWMIKPPRALREKSFVEIDRETGEPVSQGELTGENPDTLQSCVLPVSLDEPLGEDGDSRIDLLAAEDRVDQRVIDKIGGVQILREVFGALKLEERYILALQMRGRPITDLQQRFAVSRPTALKIWEELQEKVKRLYIAALEGDPLPPSEGNETLNRILMSRFEPPRFGFVDLRNRTAVSHV